jgi:glucose/arabinose dehydrogenase
MADRHRFRVLSAATLYVALAALTCGAAAPSVSPELVLELAAARPLVTHPTCACFDDRGRLLVVDSEARGVTALEDTDGDGRFDRSSVFANDLDTPRGLAWRDGYVFVASASGVWRLRDAAADDEARDRRKQLFSGAEFVGVAVGPDGMVYACTAGGAHELKDHKGGLLHKGEAPQLVRCRPDGSQAEIVGPLTGRVTGIAWTAAGDAIAAGDVLTQVVESDDRETGGPLPPMTRPGAGGASGIVRYRSMTLGRAFTGDFLCADSERHEVRRYTFARSGATFSATGDTFFRGDDGCGVAGVLEDAEGSVLILDGGGAIYRVRKDNGVRIGDPGGLKLKWDHPPVSELVRRLHDLRPCVADRAAEELAHSGSEAVVSINDLLTHTTDADARLRAVWALAQSTAASSATPLRGALLDPSNQVRQAAAYALGLRRDAESVPQLIGALADESAAVRREAANALGRIGNTAAKGAPPLEAPLGAPPAAQRLPSAPVAVVEPAPPAAAPAPAPTSAPTSAPASASPATTQPAPTTAPAAPAPQAPPSPAVPALLNVLRGGNADRFLEHAVVYALVRINDRDSTAKGLADSDPDVQRGAKMALDAMAPAKTPAPTTAPASRS